VAEPKFSLAVYCGSRTGANPAYADAAQAVGRFVGEQGGQLIYGGGKNGLMGIVADAALQAGGRVVGVIPKTLVDREQAHRGVHELHVVQSMDERKQMMIARATAFVALPGGIGTFEELFEVWTLATLGYHTKPVGLLNTASYFDQMLQFLEHGRDQGFLDLTQFAKLEVSSDVAALLGKLTPSNG
jgi:uncharacterized protein (TIGR00730 family)